MDALMRELADTIRRSNEAQHRIDVKESREEMKRQMDAFLRYEADRRNKQRQSAMTVGQLRSAIADMDEDTRVWVVGEDPDTSPLGSVSVDKDGVVLEGK